MKYHIIILFIVSFILYITQNTNNEFFELEGQYNLNRKDIWEKTKKKYGEKIALQIFPKTYLLPDEIKKIRKDTKNQFIMKTLWGSLREGVTLYNDKDEIYKDHQKYDIAQVFIENPLLIHGFKFDIRLFLVTYCGIGNFLFVKGYNVYSKKKFNYNSMDREEKINQVFTEDLHYTKNNLPRTIKDLEEYLNINFQSILKNIALKIKKILNSCNSICSNKDIGNYNIFGVDIELLDNLEPIIIEINSAPNIDFKELWKINLVSELKYNIHNKDFNNKNWIKI